MNPTMDVNRLKRLGWRGPQHEEVLAWAEGEGLCPNRTWSITLVAEGVVQAQQDPEFVGDEVRWTTVTHQVDTPPPWLAWGDG